MVGVQRKLFGRSKRVVWLIEVFVLIIIAIILILILFRFGMNQKRFDSQILERHFK